MLMGELTKLGWSFGLQRDACNGLLVNIDDGHRSKERKQLYKKHLECINSINTYLLKDI
jgi:hypothetical protein